MVDTTGLIRQAHEQLKTVLRGTMESDIIETRFDWSQFASVNDTPQLCITDLHDYVQLLIGLQPSIEPLLLLCEDEALPKLEQTSSPGKSNVDRLIRTIRSESSLELGPLTKGFYNNDALRLRRFDVRVLILHRGSGLDAITCSLETRLLPPTATAWYGNSGKQSNLPTLDCTTLSYQWGNAHKNLHKIQCNGVGFVITGNLYSALIHLRKSHSDTTLWIDAICINQRNDKEKEKQVQRMGEIYSSSKRTVIWLGEGGFLSREAFRACSMLASNYSGSAALSNPTTVARPWDPPFVILLLLRRSYFTRVWIIQEVALSRDILLACGSNTLSWWDFAIGAAIILTAGMGSKGAAGIGNILVARALLPWAPEIRQSDPAWIFQTLKQTELPQAKDILAMAILFRRSHATDPVDKIFSLLGLCEQIQKGSTHNILPTYSQNDPNHKRWVYIDTARAISSSQNSLQLFSAVNRRPQSHSNILGRFYQRVCYKKREIQPLPTWVPDWSDTGNMATPLSLMLAQTNTVSALRDSDYRIDSLQDTSVREPVVRKEGYVRTRFLQKEIAINWCLSSDHSSPNFHFLGCHIDDIKELGMVCDTEKAQSSIWFSIRYAFTMSENHRLEVFSKWEKQFRYPTTDEFFWENFLSAVTCGSHNRYEESSILRLLADYNARSPRNLHPIVKSIFLVLFVLPLLIATQTRNGILERFMMYWIFPAVAMSSFWYLCFQLTPNFMFRSKWETYGAEEGFLKADFDHMELRRMARLRSGSLALVPEASCLGDQVWSGKGGIVPLVLRPSGKNFEMVGECYSTNTATHKAPKSPEVLVCLI